MVMHVAQALGLVAAAILVAAPSPPPKVYRNQEFGITLPIPQGALACFHPSGEHDDGVLLLLGTADPNSCHDLDHSHQRYIGVFGSYQAGDTNKLGDLLKRDCDEPCEPAPEDLRIPGVRTEAGKSAYPDGSIGIIVVTQAGKPDPAFDPTVPSVNYDLSLHTGPQNLDEDLRTFRLVLRTIRLSPAQ